MGYGADTGVKSFAFVLLSDLWGQTHYFTDKGWLAAGGFCANESTVAYVVPACTPIGTVVTISRLTGQINPSTAGDQILAYSGNEASLTFLLAVDFADSTLVNAGDATNANTSVVPTGLTEGTDASALPSPPAHRAASPWATPALLRGCRRHLTDLDDRPHRWRHRCRQRRLLHRPRFGRRRRFGRRASRRRAGALNFADGQTSRTVTIEIARDTAVKADETIVLTLTNPTSGAAIGDGTATGRDQPDLMTHRLQLACPEMRTAAHLGARVSRKELE